jgi:hypothetical protein
MLRARADRVLLLGAGPVRLEVAGEISTASPDKQITVVDPADDVLTGPYKRSCGTRSAGS